MNTVSSFAGFTLPRLRGINAERRSPLACRLADARAFRRQYGRPGMRPTGPYQCRQFATDAGLSFYLDDSATMPALRYVEGRAWHADDSGEFAAIVFRLPRGRGFLAGWTMGDRMASHLERDIIADESDAMRRAESLAHEAADREQEYQEQYGEARDAADSLDVARAELRGAHGSAVGLVAVLRDLPQTAATRDTICRMIREHRARMAAALRHIATLRARLADFAAAGVEV